MIKLIGFKKVWDTDLICEVKKPEEFILPQEGSLVRVDTSFVKFSKKEDQEGRIMDFIVKYLKYYYIDNNVYITIVCEE